MRTEPSRSDATALTPTTRIGAALLSIVVAVFCATASSAAEFRNVYVPIEDLDVLFSAKKGVLLSRAEFTDLWDRAYPDGKPIEEAPEGLFLTGGDYEARLLGDALEISGTLKVLKRRSGWQTLTLPMAGVSIASATLDGKPAKLALDGERLRLFVSEPGEHALELRLSAPVGQGAEAWTARLGLPTAPGVFELTIAADREVRVDGVRLPQAGAEDEPAKVRIPLGGRGAWGLAVTKKADAEKRKTLLLARVETTVDLEPSQANWRDAIALAVYAKATDVVRIDVPVDLQVVEVKAPGLEGWESADKDNGAELTLRFEDPWTGERTVDLHSLGAPVLDRPWSLPHVRVVDAAVQTGRLRVRHAESLAVEVGRLQGAQRLSPALDEANALDFAYWNKEYRADVVLGPKVRRLATSVVSILNVARNRLDLSASVTVEPRNASLFEVPLSIAEGWAVTSIQANGRPVPYQLDSGAGRTSLRVTLPQPIRSYASVTLQLQAERVPENWLDRPGSSATLPLTTVTVEGASEVEGMLLLRSPPEIRLLTADLQGLESVPVAGVAGADGNVRIALRYRNGEVAGRLDASLEPAQVIVQADATVRLTKTHLAAHYAVRYEVRGGVTNVLTFDLPTVSENQVAVSLATGGVRLVSRDVTELADGRRRWTLTFDRDLDRPVVVLARVDVPRADLSSDADGPSDLPVLTVDGALRQSGTIAVHGASEQEVTVTTRELRAIDPSELATLPGFTPTGRLVASYRYRQVPYALSLSVTEHPEVPVLTAVCREARLVSTIDDSGLIRTQGRYAIDNVGLQNLEVTLPDHWRLVSAVLDGRPVEIRRSDRQSLIPLPNVTAGRAQVDVSLVFEGSTAPLGLSGELRQSPPKLNVSVLKLDWSVYVPDDKLVVLSTGSIAPSSPLQRDSLIGMIRDAILPTGGRRIFNPLDMLLKLMRVESQGARQFSNVAATIGGGGGFPSAKSEPAGAFNLNSGVGIKNGRDGKGNNYIMGQGAGGARLQDGNRLGPVVIGRRGDQERVDLFGDDAPVGNAQIPLDVDAIDAPQAGVAMLGDRFGNETEPSSGKDDRKQQAGQPDAVQPLVQGFGMVDDFGKQRLGYEYSAPAQGLLSLALAFEPVGKAYEFTGLTNDGELALRIQDDAYATTLKTLVALSVMFLGWFFRDARLPFRASVLAVLLAGAVGMAGLTPLRWVFLLDGLLLGALGTWSLYIGRLCVTGCCAPKAKSVAGLLVAALLAGGIAQAAEKVDATDAVKTRPDRLPTIYIPYEPEKEDPLDSKQVYLPQEDYDRLWNLANPDKVSLPDLKVPGLTVQASYRGEVKGDVAVFDATMTVWSFRDEWVGVKVPIAEVAFSKVTLDGEPATLSAPDAAPPVPVAAKPVVKRKVKPTPPAPPTGRAFPTIFVRGRGEHRLELRFETPVRRLGATGELTLHLAPCGSGTLLLALPEKDLDVRVAGLRGGWRLDETAFRSALSHGGKVTVGWQPPSARRGADLLASVEQVSRLKIGHAGIARTSRFDYLIRQGTAETLDIRVPEPVLVRSVTGKAVADWSLRGTGAERTLSVRANEPVTGKVSIEAALFLPHRRAEGEDPSALAPEQSFPEITPLGMSRETGQMAVFADPALEVGIRDAAGLQQIGRASYQGPGAENDWPMLAAYRYANRPISLRLQVADRRGKLQSEIESALVIEPERIRLVASLKLARVGASLVSARLRLPENFILDAIGTPSNVRWSRIGTDGRAIEIEQAGLSATPPGAESSLTVSIEGWVARDPNEPLVSAPVIETLGAQRQRGYWAIFLAPGLDLETERMSGLQPIGLASLPGALRSTALDFGGLPLTPRLGFRQETGSPSLSLRLRRLTPRVTVQGVTVVSVREVAVAYVTRLRWKIEQAGIRRLEFTAPDWLGRDLRVTGHGIRQTDDSGVTDGRRGFVVNLDRAVLGDYDLQIVQVLPLPEDGLVRTPRVTPTGVEASSAYALLENRSPDQLDRTQASDRSVEAIDVDRVPMPLAESLRKAAVEVFRIVSGEGELAWRMRSAETIEEITASVNLYELTMVVDREGRYRAQANLRVGNRQEQFLPLKFPDGARVWSLYVAGEPSRPATGQRGGAEVVLVPLPKTAAGDFSSLVEIVYAGMLEATPGPLGRFRRWAFPSPQVIGVPVAETQWTLYLPNEYDYSLFEGTLDEVEPEHLKLNRLSTRYREAFGLVSQASYGKGSAKARARDNLLNNLAIDDPVLQDQQLERDATRQLQQRAQSDANQLRQAVERLRQQPTETTTTANQVLLDRYFVPTPPPERPSSSEDAKKRSLKKGAKAGAARDDDGDRPQAVRSRLQRQLQSQAETLNRSNVAKDLEQQRGKEKPSADVWEELTVRREKYKASDLPVKPEADLQKQRAAGKINVNTITEEEVFRGFVDEPTRAGGLSLRIALPLIGSPLQFVKSRGTPSLSMLVTEAQASQWGVGLAWLSASLAIGLLIGTRVGRPAFRARMAHHWRGGLVLFGLIWWLALPLSALGFLCLAIGFGAFAWRGCVRMVGHA